MGLVKIDHAITFTPNFIKLSLHLHQRLLQLVSTHAFQPFLVPYVPLLDFVLLVYLPEQRRVHMRARKLSVELFASVFQWHRRLLPYGPFADKPFYMMWLNETQPKSLARLLSSFMTKSFCKRQVLHSVRFEPFQIKAPYLWARDAKQLSQQSIAHVGGVSKLFSYAAKLQLQNVIDHLLCVYFHGQELGLG